MKDMHNDAKQMEAKRLETMQKMHTEKMNMFCEFLDVLKRQKD